MFSAINNFLNHLSSTENKYSTNTEKLTCTCPDWLEKRSQHATDDPRRLCKHIIKKLDLNALPKSIQHFRESIAYYQSYDKGFNDFDFDKIIYLPQNDLKVFGLENIFHDIWMNVYDQEGQKYAILMSQWNYEFVWAKQKKPIGYEEVEEYFSHPSMKLPQRLQEYEKNELIHYMKTVIPGKENSHFSIMEDQYIPSPLGIYYSVDEDNENIKNICDHEIRWIIVKNDVMIIEMYRGQEYSIARDIEKVKFSIEEKKLFIEDSSTKFVYSEEKFLRLYGTSNRLLKEMNATISVRKFNITLEKIGMLTKVEGLNDNDWIVINGGLEYGMNLVQYNTNKTYSVIPDWYVMMDFDHNSSTFQRVTHDMMKKTDILWEKNKFNELLDLVTTNLAMKKEKINKQTLTQARKTTTKSKRQLERKEWLETIECPHCSSKNIHKKNKRVYTYGEVQRYQCMDCKKIFQEKVVNELNVNDKTPNMLQ